MQNKKILSTLIIALLTFSMIAAFIPMASAIGTPTLAPDTGPVGTEVKVSGIGATPFMLVEVYWNTPASANKLNETYATSTGAYECNVTVPEDYAGDHWIIVKDTSTGGAEGAAFTITPEIVLTPDKGLPEDLITVTGTGFNATKDIGIGFGTEASVTNEIIGTGDGTETTFTNTLENVPVKHGSVSVTDLVENFTDNDDGTLTGDAGGNGTINYATGAISVIFATAPLLDANITANYIRYEYGVTSITGVTTSDIGSFETSIEIPAIAEGDFGDYVVTAVDAEGNSATDTITVDYYIIAEPEMGPPGIKVEVSGRIEPDESVEVKFGKGTSWVTAFATTSDTDGYFSGEYTLPSLLEVATYQFKADWDTKSATTDFEVSGMPTITLLPTEEVVGETVKVTGYNFSNNANVTIYFVTTVVNETTTDTTGSFEVTFTVPTVAAGTYKVKAVDQYGASAEAYFTVVPPPVAVIQLRATKYMQGDTISFYINSSVNFGTVDISINDPSDYLFWSVTWTLVETATGSGIFVVPYEDQITEVGTGYQHLTLPSDAPLLGSWNWTATYTITTEKKATGLFTVVERPALATILDKLVEFDAKLVDIKDEVIVIDTTVGEVRVLMEALNLDAINAVITSLNKTIATISSDIGDITVNITDIGLKVVAIDDNVAIIQTDLGTIEGYVEDIDDGGLATINTALGTVETDVSDLVEAGVTVDLTVVWIAAVFSILAFLAAIAAAYMLRSKLA